MQTFNKLKNVQLIKEYPELIVCCYPDFDLKNFDKPFWIFWISFLQFDFGNFDLEGYVGEKNHSECCSFWRDGTGEWGCLSDNDQTGGEINLTIDHCHWFHPDFYSD